MDSTAVLLVLLAKACFGLRLPGLEVDDIDMPLVGNQPSDLPVAIPRVIQGHREPMFNDARSKPHIEVDTYSGRSNQGITKTTPTTNVPTRPGNNREFRMELLLNRLFGSSSWKSLLDSSASEFTKTPALVNQHNLLNYKPTSASTGYFGNKVSGDTIVNRNGQSEAMSYIQTPVHIQNQTTDQRFREEKLIQDRTYAGHFTNTRLHESKGTVSTTPLPHDKKAPFDNPATTPSRQIDTIGLSQHQTSLNQHITDTHTGESELFNPNTVNQFVSDLFDPRNINHLQNGYNQNQRPVIFNTQTGSNPLNSKWEINFDANKVNKDYTYQNKDHVEGNFPPGILLDKSDDGVDTLPLFDANQLNKALLGKNWSAGVSGISSGIMSPTFLTSNENRNAVDSDTSRETTPQENLFSSGNGTLSTAETNILTAGNTGENVTLKPPRIPQFDILNNTEMNTYPVIPRLNFIPGNNLFMYPGGSQTNKDEEQQLSRDHAPNSATPLFNPNAVNANQVVFNPNAISWIKSRTINKRSITRRNINFNGTVHDNSKFPFGNMKVSFEGSTFAPSSQHEVTSSGQTMAGRKDSFGNAVGPTIQTHVSSGNTGYGMFNPNQENGKEGNFIPGQMVPHGSESSQMYKGSKDSPYMYSPNSSNLSSLNFDIGNLLGIGSGNTDSIAGAFNPTSLNQMLMNPFSTNTSLSDGVGDKFSSAYSTGFNPNAVSFGVGSSVSQNAGSSNGYGFEIPENSTNLNQGASINTGFMGGVFDANKANVGFGSTLLNGSGSAGYGFGMSAMNNASTSSSSGALSFGMGGSFDPNTANTGFGSTDFGMGGMSGPVGAFGGTFNPDKLNAGFIGNTNNSAEISDLLDLLLGLKMTNEGSAGTANDGSGLYDPGYIGTFNPSSVNHVSYNPNEFNNIKMHFSPSDMLKSNPDMEKNTTSTLFDPDKINSLYKQQMFNPSAVLQYVTGTEQNVGTTDKGSPQQTGQLYGSADTNTPIFDPFEVMKQLMGTSNAFHPGYTNNAHVNTTVATKNGEDNSSDTSSSNLHSTHSPIHSSVTSHSLISSTSPLPTTVTELTKNTPLSTTVTNSSRATLLSTPVTKATRKAALTTLMTKSNETVPLSITL